MGDTKRPSIKIEDCPVKGAEQQDDALLLKGLALLAATVRWGWKDRAIPPEVLEQRMKRVDQMADHVGWASNLRDHLRRAESPPETQAQTAGKLEPSSAASASPPEPVESAPQPAGQPLLN